MTSQEGKNIVLIVDDDEDDVFLIQDSLSKYSYIEIKSVDDGEKFLKYLKKEEEFENDSPTPSIVLLDINMPKKNGFEVLEEIKQNHIFKTIPIILFTSSNNENDIERGYRLGANSYIAKPTHSSDFDSLMEGVTQYWFGFVKMPNSSR